MILDTVTLRFDVLNDFELNDFQKFELTQFSVQYVFAALYLSFHCYTYSLVVQFVNDSLLWKTSTIGSLDLLLDVKEGVSSVKSCNISNCLTLMCVYILPKI